MRRLKKRRSEKAIILVVVMGAGLGAVALELGRAVLYAQQVGSFVMTIDRKTPAEVKKELHGFAMGLSDRNYLIRNSSVAALKFATGWNLGNNPFEWQKWWNDHEGLWTYKPPKNANAPSATALNP